MVGPGQEMQGAEPVHSLPPVQLNVTLGTLFQLLGLSFS